MLSISLNTLSWRFSNASATTRLLTTGTPPSSRKPRSIRPIVLPVSSSNAIGFLSRLLNRTATYVRCPLRIDHNSLCGFASQWWRDFRHDRWLRVRVTRPDNQHDPGNCRVVDHVELARGYGDTPALPAVPHLAHERRCNVRCGAFLAHDVGDRQKDIPPVGKAQIEPHGIGAADGNRAGVAHDVQSPGCMSPTGSPSVLGLT